MADEHDYSAEPPRRDRSREPLDASRGRDDEWGGSLARPEVPKLVRTAGIIWIVFGCLILLNVILSLALVGSDGSNAGSGACSALFAIAFLYVGTQSLKGTATDTLGNSIGSIVIGVINAGIGGLAVVAGLALSSGVLPPGQAGQPVVNQLGLIVCVLGGVSILAGLGLILAGVLALMGRADYKAFRRALKGSAPIDD